MVGQVFGSSEFHARVLEFFQAQIFGQQRSFIASSQKWINLTRYRFTWRFTRHVTQLFDLSSICYACFITNTEALWFNYASLQFVPQISYFWPFLSISSITGMHNSLSVLEKIVYFGSFFCFRRLFAPFLVHFRVHFCSMLGLYSEYFKIQSKCSQNAVKIRSKCSQNTVKMQPKCSQNSV